jgi:hypothetical protein
LGALTRGNVNVSAVIAGISSSFILNYPYNRTGVRLFLKWKARGSRVRLVR